MFRCFFGPERLKTTQDWMGTSLAPAMQRNDRKQSPSVRCGDVTNDRSLATTPCKLSVVAIAGGQISKPMCTGRQCSIRLSKTRAIIQRRLSLSTRTLRWCNASASPASPSLLSCWHLYHRKNQYATTLIYCSHRMLRTKYILFLCTSKCNASIFVSKYISFAIFGFLLLHY